MEDLILRLILIAVIVSFNALFVFAEFSFLSVRKSKIEQLVQEGNRRAGIVLFFIEHMNLFATVTQIGITISGIALGWIGENTLAYILRPFMDWLPVGWQGVASHSLASILAFFMLTSIQVVFGELIPKAISLQHPDRISIWISPFVRYTYIAFKPAIWVLNRATMWILGLLRIPPPSSEEQAHSAKELEILISASHKHGILEDIEREMLSNILKFSEIRAHQIMVPRTMISAIPLDIAKDELLHFISSCHYSLIPVYDGEIDNVVGVIQMRELMGAIISKGIETIELGDFIRPINVVPESISLDRLIGIFKETGSRAAILMDEFGGLSGMVTMEDILREVMGVIGADEMLGWIKKMPDGTLVADGSARIKDLERILGAEFDLEEEVDTVGGLVMSKLGRIAEEGDEVEVDGIKILVRSVDRMRIRTVVISAFGRRG
jgi:CBS domain containing-hemolysin-like protein